GARDRVLAGPPGRELAPAHRRRRGCAGGLAAGHPQQRGVHLQPHLAGGQRAAAAVALPGVLDGADPGRVAGRRFAVDLGADLRPAAVRHPGRARHRRPQPGPGAGADRTGGGGAGLPRGAAPHGQVAPRPGRRGAGGADAGSGEGRAGRVPGQLPALPEAVRRAGLHPDPDAVDLPGLDRDPAGCLAGFVAGRVPLPAGVHAPAGRLRGLCAAAADRPLPRRPARGPWPAHGGDPGAGADAHRLAAAGVPRPAGGDPRAAPGRAGRVAAGPRPGRRLPGRAVRGLRRARARGRGLAAVPRGPARPGRHRGTRRPAPAAARRAAAPGRLPLPPFPRRLTRRFPIPALALLALLCACGRQATEPQSAADASPPPSAEELPPPLESPGVVDQTAEYPSFTGTAVDGKPYDLAAQRGRWVVVNFWATWCKPCLQEMPELSALHEMREDIEVVGLAYEDIATEEMQAFLRERPVSYPIVVLDP